MHDRQVSSVLDRFSAPTREWFDGAFDAPTPAQLGAWESISCGAHTLVVAPTGSGKTLSAFLWALDRLASTPADETVARSSAPGSSTSRRSRRSAVDVERNLRAPLVGITQTAKRLGLTPPDITRRGPLR